MHVAFASAHSRSQTQVSTQQKRRFLNFSFVQVRRSALSGSRLGGLSTAFETYSIVGLRLLLCSVLQHSPRGSCAVQKCSTGDNPTGLNRAQATGSAAQQCLAPGHEHVQGGRILGSQHGKITIREVGARLKGIRTVLQPTQRAAQLGEHQPGGRQIPRSSGWPPGLPPSAPWPR